ncbi:MAG TPA: O-antigen ligase family protein [Polyangiaceae bacterium]|nr:O-antigen ligase family protein [Polyangiaceae bacterium]
MKWVGLLVFGVVLLVASVVAVAAGDGNVGLAVAPALLFAAMYATWKLPLRWPLLVVTFMALTLENPADAPAQGLWRSPLYTVGALMLTHLNVTLPNRALLFSGLDVVLLYLVIVVAARSYTGARIDRPAKAAARPMRTFVLLALGGAACMWIIGVLQGGADIASSLWQVQRVVYLPVVCLLALYALRGPRDYAAFGKVIIGAACLKACVALYVVATVVSPDGKPLSYATTHPDSMLFADAACLVVILIMQRQDKKRIALAATTLPVLIAGVIANNRRLAWVEIILGLLVVFSLVRQSPFKRAVKRAAIMTSPLAIPYVLVGWSSTSKMFRPVQVMRSVVDSRTDMSTLWRDLENYDLLDTLRQHPLFGTGYGHGYVETIKLPDVESAYSLERFIPHNAILGLWTYGGLVGFTLLWTMFSVGVFFAARAHHHAKDLSTRAAALSAITTVVVYFFHCYGDMGLGTWVGVFTVAPSLAISARLAVETGAWNEAPARTAVRVKATAREVVV